METVIHGCRLFYRYEKQGNADAPVLLFLHGWGCDGSVFSFLKKAAASQASVLTLDFPGHGQSAEPSQPWGVPEYAEQVYGLLQQLQIQAVRIVAHSFGARVAIYLASQHPELVEKMILTGAAGLRAPASSAQTRRQKNYKRLKKLVEGLGRCRLFGRPVRWGMRKLREHYGSEDYKRLSDGMRATFVKVINLDLSDRLPMIKAPTLLVWGSEDTATPLWMGKRMEAEIPDAGLAVFEGRSHFAFAEEPQRFLVILKTFLLEGETA